MKEVRIHGRGGQGVVFASDILSNAIVLEGRYAAGFPFFGSERRGAPVKAFLRIDDNPIREHTRVYTPEIVLVIDQSLSGFPLCYEGLQPNGIIVANTGIERIAKACGRDDCTIAHLDANVICLEEMGVAITNCCMLGAFAGATGLVSLEALEKAMAGTFKGKLLEGNLRCLRRGYAEVKVAAPEKAAK